jgi:DNA-binding SARP family transcriptional activator
MPSFEGAADAVVGANTGMPASVEADHPGGVIVSLQVAVLGPVIARFDGHELGLGPPLQRAVFAVLAAHSHRTVSMSELIDAVWGDRSPASADGSVHTYMSALRRQLPPNDRQHPAEDVLVSSRAGYRLRLEPGDLDTEVAEEHRARAQRFRDAGDLAPAIGAFDAALGLWRGVPYAGLPGPFAEVERNRWLEVQLALAEARADCLLGAGRHAEVAAELPTLIGQQPLREPLREMLMLALYRSGRAAEALEQYQRTRRVLAEQLGIDPGPRMRQLYTQILNNDPVLQRPPAANTSQPAAQAKRIPAQLPHGMADFTGRSEELANLRGLLADRDADQGPVVISAIDGAGGIGKTALAVQFCHEVADRYSDGQLYVNLRGFVPDQAPARPEDTLAQLLVALGIGTGTIPQDLAERAALYRSLLVDKKVLILLDNAVSAEQIRPLLPGAGGSLVLVTSRNRLGGLVARDGARRLTLDTLPPADAMALLTAMLGQDRIEAEADAAAELAELCGYLPLALRVAGERVAINPGSSIAGLVEELRDEHERLDLLSTGEDDFSAVRAVFSWSYQSLKPETAQLFRLLGLHAGPDISLSAAAALAGVSNAGTRKLLDTLASGHLIEPTASDRYRFHDLLRVYAGECAVVDETTPGRVAAVHRVLDWYLHTAVIGQRILRPERPVPMAAADPSIPPASLTSREQAMDWFDDERLNLMAAITQARDQGMHDIAWKLNMAMSGYFSLREAGLDRLSAGLIALDSAQQLGEKFAECLTLDTLGVAYGVLDRIDDALDAHLRALTLSRDIGMTDKESVLLNNIGADYHRIGQSSRDEDAFNEAARYYEQSGTLAESIGMLIQQALAFSNLAEARFELGQFEGAVTAGQQALNAAQQMDDPRQRARYSAWAQKPIADAYDQLGLVSQALEAYRQVLNFYDEAGDLNQPSPQAETLWKMGGLLRRLGRHQEGIARLEQAEALYQRIEAVEGTQWRNDLRAVQDALAEYQAAQSHAEDRVPTGGTETGPA